MGFWGSRLEAIAAPAALSWATFGRSLHPVDACDVFSGDVGGIPTREFVHNTAWWAS